MSIWIAMHIMICLAIASERPVPPLAFAFEAVDLVELLEDPVLLTLGNAGARIGHGNVEVAVDRGGG
jgi:hypothetical protein